MKYFVQFYVILSVLVLLMFMSVAQTRCVLLIKEACLGLQSKNRLKCVKVHQTGSSPAIHLYACVFFDLTKLKKVFLHSSTQQK